MRNPAPSGALRAVTSGGALPRMRDLAAALDAHPLDARLVARLDPHGGALADIDNPDDLQGSAMR